MTSKTMTSTRSAIRASRCISSDAIKGYAFESTITWAPQLGIYRFLRAPMFEYSMGLIILGNFVLIIAETDFLAKDEETSAPIWMTATSWSVLILFVVELMMRLFSERWHFFADPWNQFDFAIVATDFIFSGISMLLVNIFPISLLRILRLAKVARLSKVFRVFPELRLMLAGLIGSVRAIMWGTVLLFVAMLVVSVIAVQFIHPLNKLLAADGVYPGCERCGDAFATVLGSALTFTQTIIAGDSWGEVTIPVIEHYPATAIYFIMVYLLIGLAIVNLILGIVVDVAQEARKSLMKELDRKKNLAMKESRSNLLHLCTMMDSDKDGTISKQELHDGFDDHEEFRTALLDLDVNKDDLDIIWTIMDADRSGTVDYTEFVTELYNMKTSDIQFMLAYIKFYMTQMKDTILSEVKHVEQMAEDVQHMAEDAQHEERENCKNKVKQEHIEEELDKRVGEVNAQTQEIVPKSIHTGSIQEPQVPLDGAAPDPYFTSLYLSNDTDPLSPTMDLSGFRHEIREQHANLMRRLQAIDIKLTVPPSDSMQSSLPLHGQKVNAENDRIILEFPRRIDSLVAVPKPGTAHDYADVHSTARPTDAVQHWSNGKSMASLDPL